MRPIRLVLSLSASLAAILLVAFVALGSQPDEQLEQNSASGKQGGFKALLSFTSPGSLFPPSAIISLTDDNSTFFLARPAAFGPTLPADGLSSPLWIGSGFGDDAMGRGELGCGDSPDWESNSNDLEVANTPLSKHTSQKRPHMATQDKTTEAAADALEILEDGTDDHLHAKFTVATTQGVSKKHVSGRSDIKTLQQSAEIEGKVVLLKRGGCGFLAKVLWAQKRGAVAVIVGDDVRGGDLIRMYANGDTSNVTISSLFTSHTTAHLLSSLLPRGITHGLLSTKPVNPDVESGESHGYEVSNKKQPTSSPSAPKPSPTSGPKELRNNLAQHSASWNNWLSAMFSMFGYRDGEEESMKAGSRRPPASGDLHGLPAEAWEDDQKLIKTKVATTKPTSAVASDGFTIGKQDWRDADVLPTSVAPSQGQTLASAATVATKTGGGNLPGSGEYAHRMGMTDSERKAWWTKWYNAEETAPTTEGINARSVTSITGADMHTVKTASGNSAPHEGLWVTLTPTNVSTSPFFDTLLVLVVSPLVTLTVVYALLLLRSRIRRRRWRAPKSLVERLPVRTYQTMSDSSSSATPLAASPTTPLLQHPSPRATSPEATSPAPSQVFHLDEDEEEQAAATSSTQDQARTREEEKRETGLAEWRRRYGGRQKECVVCLDEYVDGVSQVMSLPCGHEFHADCM
jgi:hypothetical protein